MKKILSYILTMILMTGIVLGAATISPNEPVDNIYEDDADNSIKIGATATVDSDNTTIFNMSIYGTANGTSFALLEVNSSGVITAEQYNFSVGHIDSVLTWQIEVCTNDTANSCVRTTNRTYTEDSIAPIVALSSPLVGTVYDTPVTFTYTPTDTNFGNCTLHISSAGGSAMANDQTDTSITTATSNTFSKTLTTSGGYNWNVQCNDLTQAATHTINSSTGVFYWEDAGGLGGGGGGGGGGASQTTTTTTSTTQSVAGDSSSGDSGSNTALWFFGAIVIWMVFFKKK